MTAFGWLAALLPIAVVAGWYAGRLGGQRQGGQKVNRLSSSYFRGLNYLLNEQPDKAIEVFLKIAELDSESVETHFALGSLFRRRGEVDRAIRLHQTLVSKASLSDEEKTRAVLELGEDYMRAGLLDRAETLFEDMVSIGASAPAALRHLIAIYQAERDWDKAIEHASAYEKATSEPMGKLIANFYCELAEDAWRRGESDRAREHLASAHASDLSSVRVGIIEGRMHISEGNDQAAVRVLERVARLDPDYLPEMIEPLMSAYGRRDDLRRGRAFLSELVEHHPGTTALLALTRLIDQQDGRRAAIDFLISQLRRRPSVRGQGALLELGLADASPQEREMMTVLKQLTDQLLSSTPTFRCSRCGFGARAHHWQCPSCKSWGTVKPIHGAVGD